MTEATRAHYVAPEIKQIGTIAEITQGAIPGNTGDGRSGRGPAVFPGVS